MIFSLNLWNIHDWLSRRQIAHLYTLDEITPAFQGIRFSKDDIDKEKYACLTDELNNRQYKSVLSFQNGRIYFNHLSAPEAMNLLNTMLSDYKNWQKELYEANLSHAPLQHLLGKTAAFFPYPLMLLHNSDILASTDSRNEFSKKLFAPFTEEKTLPLNDLCRLLPENNREDQPFMIPLRGNARLLVHTIRTNKTAYRLIAYDHSSASSPGDLLLMEVISRFICRNLSDQQQGPSAGVFSADSFFTELCEGKPASQNAEEQILRLLRWEKEDSFLVFCIHAKAGSPSFCLDLVIAKMKQVFPSCYPFIYDHCLFLICNENRSERIPAEADFEEMLSADFLFIGMSNRQKGFDKITDLISQAKQAALIAELHRRFFVNTQSISTQAVLRQFYSDEALQALVHPAIRRLKEYDDANPNSFGYLSTLEAYLTNGANISAAARQLGLHRNSLVNRIERIKELSALSLTDPEELEALLLSLIIFKEHTTESGKFE